MPKKGAKKGGGGKQAGMTEEERLLYVQQRAQAEAELARRKEEMLTLFLRDKLQKEEKNGAVNLHKLTQQWRAILRQTRSAELRSDISVLSQTFERVLDRKESVIQCLVSDLREAERQSARARGSHQYAVDRLLALQKDRLASLQQRWDGGLEELSGEFDSEREKILSQHQQEEAYLGDVTSAMELLYAEMESEALQDYQSARDEIKNRNIEEKEALQFQRDGTLKSLESQLKDAKTAHGEATKDRRVAFEALRARDQRSAQEIDAQMKRLQKMQGSIATLRAELSSSQREGAAASQGLRATKEEVTLQARQLKLHLSHARAAERSRLADLTIHSNAAAKKLQHVITKGERVLRLAEMCRKLESEREKVLPFSLTPEEQSQEKPDAAEPPSEELAKAMQDNADLERFLQRYNKVLLERLCLDREREVLTRENRQLQVLLRQHLDGISVSDDVLRQRNSLLVVSRPAPAERGAATAGGQRDRHATVTEAAHVARRTL